MSLFDELLTKSQTSGSSASSELTGNSQNDPLVGGSIIINETSSVPTTVTDGVVMIPIEPPVPISADPVKKVPVSNDALIVSEDEPVMTSSTVIPEKINSEPVQPTNSLFGMINASDESVQNESSQQEQVSSFSKSDKVVFRDTNEYIEHAIDEVSELISSLEAADQAKLVEESEYEHQKEHFAELEVQAESEHQKILAEKAHAEEMKKYLESERVAKESAVDEVVQEEQNEEAVPSEQVPSEQISSETSSSEEEDIPEENVSPKKKEWTGFGKKNNKSEEESREVFI